MAIHIKESHKGRLHQNLGVAKGKKIPAAALERAIHSSSGALRKQAQFAKNARSWKH